MIKAVLFDLDGTLADSLADLTDGVNLALSKFGYPLRTIEEVKSFVGNGIINLLDCASSHTASMERINELREEFYKYYGDHYCYKTTAYDGLSELIAALHERGIQTAVVTNKDDEVAKDIVNKLLGDNFAVIRGKLDGCPAKPDPESTLSVMSELRVKPEECIFLGDSGVDIMTGLNSGAIPVGETWGFRDEAHLREHGAEHIIHHPLELLEIIDLLNK